MTAPTFATIIPTPEQWAKAFDDLSYEWRRKSLSELTREAAWNHIDATARNIALREYRPEPEAEAFEADDMEFMLKDDVMNAIAAEELTGEAPDWLRAFACESQENFYLFSAMIVQATKDSIANRLEIVVPCRCGSPACKGTMEPGCGYHDAAAAAQAIVDMADAPEGTLPETLDLAEDDAHEVAVDLER